MPHTHHTTFLHTPLCVRDSPIASIFNFLFLLALIAGSSLPLEEASRYPSGVCLEQSQSQPVNSLTLRKPQLFPVCLVWKYRSSSCEVRTPAGKDNYSGAVTNLLCSGRAVPVARTCGVLSARMEEETVVTVDEGGSVVASGVSGEGAVSPVVRQLRSGRTAADIVLLGARSKTDRP